MEVISSATHKITAIASCFFLFFYLIHLWLELCTFRQCSAKCASCKRHSDQPILGSLNMRGSNNFPLYSSHIVKQEPPERTKRSKYEKLSPSHFAKQNASNQLAWVRRWPNNPFWPDLLFLCIPPKRPRDTWSRKHPETETNREAPSSLIIKSRKAMEDPILEN